ncbi:MULTISPECIES: LLM class F420-dependent oxidoreductase [Pseudonocardia]|uniref:Pyrimidine monooxygenase RutA n=2 Tax=Pseudonocardia TaxID=1847 RepID=A0A1Y2MSF1_PSEAH|nr:MULTISPECIES: LLM class F420-dependent oxidoreductase [Pseudonocardia]OSY37448.1 Pyrimidine monooxygenase RutA [Pseudonocardia autotrophica]TDN77227.1 F420-dependent oxidoreductase-like protein [Pseudonocardia autotrophica]BBG01246.1 LLM class F420-dependent oxidoreductase [Pseudonocardia autotrophica]GEC25973.1 LLM class F420-dependent oxidoreductase [Pseudonocardia saturnea]
MDFRIFTEPQQGASYSELLRVARATQDAGYDAFFRSDHFLAMGDGTGLPGPTDAWVTLAALGRETERIRLGTLVTSATFRLPGPLAVAVAQADEMSGGRIELGIGAGWFEAEHAALGIPFPPLGQRFEILTEQLEILTGLWATPQGGRFDHRGTHYTITDSPALPRPVQDAPPVVVGGKGKRRTPALAARFASEFNVPFQEPDAVAAQFGRVRDACRAIGRDPAELTYSVAQMLCLGRDDAEIAHRAAAVGRDVAEVRANCLAGTPDEVVDQLGRWSERTGATRFYLQILDLSDLDHVEQFATSVMGQLG